jgi:hypothetical protein
MIDLAKAHEEAKQYRVLFLPIGCNSAKAGAYFGFERTIDSSEVARFLEAIPGDAPTVGDLFGALQQIGAVSVDARRFGAFLEAVIVRKVKTPAGNTETYVVTVFRIPAAMPPAGNSVTSTFLDEWVDDHRPWHDRGPLRWGRMAFRDWPILAAMGSSIALFMLWGVFRALDSRGAHLPPNWFTRIPRRLLGLAGLGMAGFAALLVIVETWPAALVVGGFIAFTSLASLIFDLESTHPT